MTIIKSTDTGTGHMLHIAICDDEKDFVAHLTDLLKRYAAETGEEIKVTAFYDGIGLTEHYDTTIDLIFLDIQMKLVNGLTAAGRIRQLDETVGIIFLTSLSRYGLEGYRYQAENYIIKPLKYIRLKTELDRWRKKHEKTDDPALTVSNDTGTYRVQLKSLRYVETFQRNLLLHTGQESVICYRSMKEMERALSGAGFARCHTSYLVNLAYIKRINKLEITLITGEALPVSQPRRKKFTELLTEYWGDLL